MNSVQLGRLGEAKIISKLVELGYEVFVPVGGNTSCDLVAVRDNLTHRVECKTVSMLNRNNTYSVQLKQVRPNRSGNVIKGFNNTQCELLAVYIVPEDRVVLLVAAEVTATSALAIKPLVG